MIRNLWKSENDRSDRVVVKHRVCDSPDRTGTYFCGYTN